MRQEDRWDGEDMVKRVRDVIAQMSEVLRPGPTWQMVREKIENARWRGQIFSGRSQKARQKPLEIRVRWKGRITGILQTVYGAMGLAGFGTVTVWAAAAALTSSPNPEAWQMAALAGAISTAALGLMCAGIFQRKRISRLKRYIEELKRNGRPYYEIEKLSRDCDRSPDFVRKDLRKILRLGMLPDARMDREGSWIFLDQESYRQYQLLQESLEMKREEQETARETRETRDTQEARENQEESPLDMAVRQGEQYRAKLEQLRQAMKSDPIEEKLARLDNVLVHLFEALKKHPEQLDELEKLMEYYLPTTVKLTESYREFAAVKFPGEKLKEAKEEILETLDIVNGAFEKLVDDLYQDAAFDVMTDASVLQTMLAREGMTGTDFGDGGSR